MNLIESIALVSILVGLGGGAIWAMLEGLQPVLVIGAAVAGGLAVPVALVGVAMISGFIHARLHGDPYWPACTACGGVDFTIDPSSGVSVARCGCGLQYVRHGRQCRQVLAGGASRAHLRWRSVRGWIDDQDAPPTEPVDSPYRGSDHE